MQCLSFINCYSIFVGVMIINDYDVKFLIALEELKVTNKFFDK